MDHTNKFQRLKDLHQNLHSRGGLSNITSMNNSSCMDSKHIVPVGNELVGCAKEQFDTSLIKCASEEGKIKSGIVRGSNGLLKAVKNVYVDNDVQLTEPKIFVGNISYKLSTLQLKEFFSSFGRVIFAQIVKDRVKRRSKG